MTKLPSFLSGMFPGGSKIFNFRFRSLFRDVSYTNVQEGKVVESDQVGTFREKCCGCVDFIEKYDLIYEYTSSTARGGAGSFKKVNRPYNPEEHLPIESFVTTLIDEPFSDDTNKVGICWLCRSTQLHVTASST